MATRNEAGRTHAGAAAGAQDARVVERARGRADLDEERVLGAGLEEGAKSLATVERLVGGEGEAPRRGVGARGLEVEHLIPRRGVVVEGFVMEEINRHAVAMLCETV